VSSFSIPYLTLVWFDSVFIYSFLVVSYNMLKNRRSEGGGQLTSALTLLYAAEASQSCPAPSDARELAKYRIFRCRYRDTHKPHMGGESPDVHDTSKRSHGVPGHMAYVSALGYEITETDDLPAV
jgi:hypothetical protein